MKQAGLRRKMRPKMMKMISPKCRSKNVDVNQTLV
jgi:hypothetical protein